MRVKTGISEGAMPFNRSKDTLTKEKVDIKKELADRIELIIFGRINHSAVEEYLNLSGEEKKLKRRDIDLAINFTRQLIKSNGKPYMPSRKTIEKIAENDNYNFLLEDESLISYFLKNHQ